ncbi:MAG: flagellar hook-basal body complex protein [Opitutaceae bacterium]
MSLISTLTSGVSALRSFSVGLQTIGNDIANVSTTGYKKGTVNFADTFTAAGVQPTGVSTSYIQGALESTGNVTDLGISGNGFFIVTDASGKQFATRDGAFHYDATGRLVTSQGFAVQGLVGAAVADIPLGTPPASTQLQSISIDTSGNVTEHYSDGSTAVTAQILLQDFSNPGELSKEGNNLYGNLDAAIPVGGTVFATPANNVPGTNGLGAVRSGTLEQSNVDLTEEFSRMITMQRSFQAGARLITVSDSLLEDIVNLKQR